MNDKILRPLIPADGKPVKVLFVCLGNICRSPAAEELFRQIVIRSGDESSFVIDSAGTGGYHAGLPSDKRMILHARRRGYELTHICRKISHADMETFDIVIAMDAANAEDLRQLAQSVEEERKVVPISLFLDPGCGYDYVPDPYYEGAEGFELVLDLLEEACRNLYNEIKQLMK